MSPAAARYVDRMAFDRFEAGEAVQAGAADQGEINVPAHASTA